MSKWLFFDIDGTLSYHGTIPKSTKIALAKLHEQGHKIVIATGRNYLLAKPFIDIFKADGYICCNGKYVVFQDEVILDQPIDPTDIASLMIDVSDFGAYTWLSLHHFKTPHLANEVVRFVDALAIPHPTIDPKHPLEAVYLMNICADDETHTQALKAKYPHLDFIRVNKYGHDIIQTGGHKGLGVQAIIKKMDVQMKDTIAFGDNINDLDMLTSVHHSIAMGNAHPEVKSVASFTTKHALDDGIMHALTSHLNLIEE